MLISEGACGFSYIIFWAIYGKISSKHFFPSCSCGELKRKENILCPNLIIRTKAAMQFWNFTVTSNCWQEVQFTIFSRLCNVTRNKNNSLSKSLTSSLKYTCTQKHGYRHSFSWILNCNITDFFIYFWGVWCSSARLLYYNCKDLSLCKI